MNTTNRNLLLEFKAVTALADIADELQRIDYLISNDYAATLYLTLTGCVLRQSACANSSRAK